MLDNPTKSCDMSKFSAFLEIQICPVIQGALVALWPGCQRVESIRCTFMFRVQLEAWTYVRSKLQFSSAWMGVPSGLLKNQLPVIHQFKRIKIDYTSLLLSANFWSHTECKYESEGEHEVASPELVAANPTEGAVGSEASPRSQLTTSETGPLRSPSSVDSEVSDRLSSRLADKMTLSDGLSPISLGSGDLAQRDSWTEPVVDRLFRIRSRFTYSWSRSFSQRRHRKPMEDSSGIDRRTIQFVAILGRSNLLFLISSPIYPCPNPYFPVLTCFSNHDADESCYFVEPFGRGFLGQPNIDSIHSRRITLATD
ncbi:unnamed protein product [Protopolystoma xenopodis]|uniref:Uncharacterized protein n=1 Tax=Protopolystoma xenopodis TaxID=117903 RepID=A0A448WPB4_9PLAT|nr:unnamed protein product [Protopolystoma xenopodis]